MFKKDDCQRTLENEKKGGKMKNSLYHTSTKNNYLSNLELPELRLYFKIILSRSRYTCCRKRSHFEVSDYEKKIYTNLAALINAFPERMKMIAAKTGMHYKLSKILLKY